MANNLFISYDLHEAPRERYEAVQAAIAQLGTAVYLEFSLFYVKSKYSIQQCRDHVAKQMTKQDKLLVIDAANAIPQNIESEAWKKVLALWNT